MRVALQHFGYCTSDEDLVVEHLLWKGRAQLASGYHLRLVAFGTSPPNKEKPIFKCSS